jgi:hypothetical protein
MLSGVVGVRIVINVEKVPHDGFIHVMLQQSCIFFYDLCWRLQLIADFLMDEVAPSLRCLRNFRQMEQSSFFVTSD